MINKGHNCIFFLQDEASNKYFLKTGIERRSLKNTIDKPNLARSGSDERIFFVGRS